MSALDLKYELQKSSLQLRTFTFSPLSLRVYIVVLWGESLVEIMRKSTEKR